MSTERDFTPQADSLPDAIKFVETNCAALLVPAPITNRLLVILDELFVNAITHGNNDKRSITLALRRDLDEVALVFIDGGAEYNPFEQNDTRILTLPAQQRPVGGLGVLLVRSLATSIDYLRRDGRNQITVTLAI